MFIVAEVLRIAGPAEVDDGLRFLGFLNTLRKTNVEAKNEVLEDDFPFQRGDLQVPR